MAKRKRTNSSVGTSRRVREYRTTLPDWYYRVIKINEGCPSGSDFDLDISDLSQDDSDSDGDGDRGGDTDGDDDEKEADADTDGDQNDAKDTDGDESERSYDGDDADWYYELKAEREDRKYDLRESKKLDNPRKDRERKEEIAKGEEVEAAYQALWQAEENSKTIPIGSLEGDYYLYCTEHFDLFDHEWARMKTLCFENSDLGLGERRPGMLGGFITITDGPPYIHFPYFHPPKYASRKLVRMTGEGDGGDGSRYDLTFQFLGNGYLKVWIPWEQVISTHPWRDRVVNPVPPDHPEMFEFAGVWRDPVKEKAQRIENERKRKLEEARPRANSPRETQFNMYHPEGDFYDEVGAHFDGGY